MFSGGVGGAGGKRTSKSARASNFAPDTPILRSVQPKIVKISQKPVRNHNEINTNAAAGAAASAAAIAATTAKAVVKTGAAAEAAAPAAAASVSISF